MVVLFSIAGCGLQPAPKPISNSQLVTEAVSDFEQAAAIHLKGSLTTSDGAFSFDADVTRPSDVSGTVGDGKDQVKVVVVGDTVYLSGSDMGAVAGDAVPPNMSNWLASRWVTDSKVNFGLPWLPTLHRVVDRGSLSDAFVRGQTSFKRSPYPSYGKSAIRLSNAEENIYLDPAKKPVLLAIDRPVGAPTLDGFTNFDVHFATLDTAPTIQKPPNAVDIGDISQLPAYYDPVPGTLAFNSCTYSSCGATAKVTNSGGNVQPNPNAVITFKFERGDGTPIDSCQVEVPFVSSGSQESVGCSISGSSWTAFVQSGGYQYQVVPTISNPLFDKTT